MPHESAVSFIGRGDQGAGSLRVRIAGQAIDAPAADPEPLLHLLPTHNMKSMTLRLWAEGNDVAVALKRQVGKNADGSPIWEDEVALATRTAAANPNAVNPATEVTTWTVANITHEVFGIFAKRAADPNDGILHVYGSAKS